VLRKIIVSWYGFTNAVFVVAGLITFVLKGYPWWTYVILAEASVIAALLEVIWRLTRQQKPTYSLADQAAERRALRDELQRRGEEAQVLLEKARRAFDNSHEGPWGSWKQQAEAWINETATFIGEHVGTAEKADFLNVPSLPVPRSDDADYARWTLKLSDRQTLLRDIIRSIPST